MSTGKAGGDRDGNSASTVLLKPVAPQRRRNWLSILILVAIACALYFFVDLKAVWETVRVMPLHALVMAILIATGVRFAMGYKWRHLIVNGGGKINLLDTVSAYYQAAFSGRLMPIGFGQEIVRGYLVQRTGVPVEVVAASMGIEKLIAVVANVVIALAALLYLTARIGPDANSLLVTVSLVALALCVAGFAVVFSRPLHVISGRLIRKWTPTKVYSMLGRFSSSMLAYRGKPSVLVTNLGLAVVEQFMVLAKFYVLGIGVGIVLPPLAFFSTIAVVLFARRVTAYFEGWGLTEATSVLLFTLLGVSQEQAVALALVNYGVTTLALAPGLYLLYRTRQGVGDAKDWFKTAGGSVVTPSTAAEK
jgi:uncharacterized protein (TIRG00374 family)